MFEIMKEFGGYRFRSKTMCNRLLSRSRSGSEKLLPEELMSKFGPEVPNTYSEEKAD